jgi:hypothetical protein
MLTYTVSNLESDLFEITKLQKINLFENLSLEERKDQGFLTVCHSLNQLKKMSSYEPHLIAKDNQILAGFLLAMTKNSKNDIPILIPMFNLFEKITFKENLISEYNYIVVGQVCIGKEYRRQGILDNSYMAYKDYFESKYDFAITEIATTNKRSLNAHKRVGFKEIHKYTDFQNTEWSIVIWDWKS